MSIFGAGITTPPGTWFQLNCDDEIERERLLRIENREGEVRLKTRTELEFPSQSDSHGPRTGFDMG